VIRYFIEVWDDGSQQWFPVLNAPPRSKTANPIEIIQVRLLTRTQADRRLVSLRKRLPTLTFRVSRKES
jgi:hypothetical protein